MPAEIPGVDAEIRALMDETLAMLGRGTMQPERIEPWWEERRENEQTPDYLGRVLDEAGLPEMAENARMGHYDDFHAPAEFADGLEIIRLVRDMRRAGREDPEKAERLAVIENAVRRGDFDATKAESDRWAASKDGQGAYEMLVRSLPNSRKPGRNHPCPCQSGKKWKHCHGR